MDLHTPLYLGIAAFLTQGFFRPALKRYETWKADPNRVQVAGRDWRGRYIPDLRIKRAERAAWVLLVLLAAAGVLVLGVIFANAPSSTS